MTWKKIISIFVFLGFMDPAQGHSSTHGWKVSFPIILMIVIFILILITILFGIVILIVVLITFLLFTVSQHISGSQLSLFI